MLEEVGLLSTGLLLLGYVHGHCIGVVFESLRLSGRLFEVRCLGDFDLIVLERGILVVSKTVVDQSRDDTAIGPRGGFFSRFVTGNVIFEWSYNFRANPPTPVWV
jgi:hypothetical protein